MRTLIAALAFRRRRVRKTKPIRRSLGSPLPRWGFTFLALFAVWAGLTLPALVCGALAWAAWNSRGRRR